MNALTWLKHAAEYGFHGSYLLIFAILIWLVFFLVLLSNPTNRINVRCFIAGLIAGIGAFKEYLFYELGPVLIDQGVWTAECSEAVYSVLSAVFCDLVMPSFLVFGLYFFQSDKTRPQLFPRLAYVCYAPAVLMAVIFPVTQTHALQSQTAFCLTMGLYNWFYGLLMTLLLLHTLRRDRLTAHYRQLQLASFSVLIPLWSWLILAFPYHALGIPSVSKLWQLNLLVLFLVFLFLMYHFFTEGIWGFRFKRERYEWNSDEKKLKQSANYARHALSSDLSKIKLCTELMKQQGIQSKELEIIRTSTSHLTRLLQSISHYSDRITCQFCDCDIRELFKHILEHFVSPQDKAIAIEIAFCDKELLNCDPTHLEEVLHNLINNAIDVLSDGGMIHLSYTVSPLRHQAVISVQDNGPGMENSSIKTLTEPFYTTKANGHMGLGLTYCWNVMNAHGGQLQMESFKNQGTIFYLVFPFQPHKSSHSLTKGGSLLHEEDTNHSSRG